MRTQGLAGLSRRVATLESAAPEPTNGDEVVTDYALERMTDSELDEARELFRHNGVEHVAELPEGDRARLMALIQTASARRKTA